MVSILLLLLVCGFSYLLGSIPFGLLVARWFGKIDIRTMGSGNIGATNVGRVMGLRWFVVVFVLDALKGLLPTGLGMWLASGLGLWQSSAPLREVSMTLVPVLAGLAAVLGHMFPCWLGFRGERGGHGSRSCGGAGSVGIAGGGVAVRCLFCDLAYSLGQFNPGGNFVWRLADVSVAAASLDGQFVAPGDIQPVGPVADCLSSSFEHRPFAPWRGTCVSEIRYRHRNRQTCLADRVNRSKTC